jgi:hypothetical protein
LIDKMKADRRARQAGPAAALMSAFALRREQIALRRDGIQLRKLNKSVAARIVWRRKGTLAPLATERPMLRTIALGIVVGGALMLGRGRNVPALIAVGVVPTAAHHQVDRKHHGGCYAIHPIHAGLSCHFYRPLAAESLVESAIIRAYPKTPPLSLWERGRG